MEGTSPRVLGDVDRHAANLSRSLRELQRMVKEHEETLNRIQESSRSQQPHAVGREASAASYEILASGYQEAAESPPILLFQESVLPALLAMRRTQNTISESREFLEFQSTRVDKARKRLDAEEANLRDQHALRTALEQRIASLQNELESRQSKTRAQVNQERLEDLRRKKQTFEKDSAALLRTLNSFITDQLGPLLAAEELGGPVVGDMMDIDSNGLAAGFSAQGRVKKPKKAVEADRRQQRIDQIWGSAADRPGSHRTNEDWDEAAAAALDLRELTDELVTSLMESGGDSLAAYVRVERDSAAARLLVRSKVAQFHPKDATRLRLIDYGRELED